MTCPSSTTISKLRMATVRPCSKRNRSSTNSVSEPVQRRRLVSSSTQPEMLVELGGTGPDTAATPNTIFNSHNTTKLAAGHIIYPEIETLPEEWNACNTNREFPFPVQTTPSNLFETKIIEVDDEAEPDYLAAAHAHRPRMGSDAFPKPPRIFGSISTDSCDDAPPPSPSSSRSASEVWSPLSPITPLTPATSIGSSYQARRQHLLARDLDMSVDDLQDLEEFANMSVSGSTKRCGRVLVHRRIRQRRTSTQRRRSSGNKQADHDPNSPTLSQLPLPRMQPNEWWREVSWSTWSDSSSCSSMDSAMGGLDEQEGPFGETLGLENEFPVRLKQRPVLDYRVGRNGWSWPT